MAQTQTKQEQLSPSQREWMKDVRAAMARLYPIPPSVQDVADEMGVTKKTASVRLQKLQKKGKVTRDGRKSRTLRLVRKAS